MTIFIVVVKDRNVSCGYYKCLVNHDSVVSSIGLNLARNISQPSAPIISCLSLRFL